MIPKESKLHTEAEVCVGYPLFLLTGKQHTSVGREEGQEAKEAGLSSGEDQSRDNPRALSML